MDTLIKKNLRLVFFFTFFCISWGLNIYSPVQYNPLEYLGLFCNFYRTNKLLVKQPAVRINAIAWHTRSQVPSKQVVLGLLLTDSCHKPLLRRRVLKLYVCCKNRRGWKERNPKYLSLFLSHFPVMFCTPVMVLVIKTDLLRQKKRMETCVYGCVLLALCKLQVGYY